MKVTSIAIFLYKIQMFRQIIKNKMSHFRTTYQYFL